MQIDLSLTYISRFWSIIFHLSSCHFLILSPIASLCIMTDSYSTIIFKHMLPILLSPISILGISLIFQESSWASQRRRCSLFILIIALACLSIWSSSTLNPIWSYGWGLFNAWSAIVWTPLWLWCLDTRSCQRLHRTTDNKSQTTWTVEQQPAASWFARFCWTMDLLTDLRAVAWSHGLRKDSPWHKIRVSSPPDVPREEKRYIEAAIVSDDREHSAFLRESLLRLVVLCAKIELLNIAANYYVHFLLDVESRSALDYSIHKTTRALVSAACIYCLISSIHTVVTFAQMAWYFVRTRQAPPTWMFPALFGSKISMNLASKSNIAFAHVHRAPWLTDQPHSVLVTNLARRLPLQPHHLDEACPPWWYAKAYRQVDARFSRFCLVWTLPRRRVVRCRPGVWVGVNRIRHLCDTTRRPSRATTSKARAQDREVP